MNSKESSSQQTSMSLFAKALRCLYQDKDAVYLWPEGFAACAAVCAESRASLDDV